MNHPIKVESTSTEKKKVVTVTDPKIDERVREKLIVARVSLLLKAPFFGNLATRLKLTNADEWLATAATDGRNFYYNSEFVDKLPQKQVEFLMGHEVLHVVYDHMGRCGDRIPQLYNIACDYCVNADLIDQKIGEKITVVPILFDTKYKGLSSEEVYDLLMENVEKISAKDLADMLLDDHMDGDGDDDGDGEGDEQREGGGPGSGRPRLTEEEKRQIRDEIREAVLSAAEAAGAGNLPAGVKRMIKSLTNPQLNWRELIQQQIQSLVKADFTWMRPSRRSWHMDAVMPGNNLAHKIEVEVSIDASGSMTDEMLRDILSEVKGIMQTFDDFTLRVWSFDTEVYNFAEFSPDNIDDIDTWVPGGGGGTIFECNWEFMRENDIQSKLFIMFTDGYPGNTWGDPEYCDTLFVIHGGFRGEAPFGITAYYEFEKNNA